MMMMMMLHELEFRLGLKLNVMVIGEFMTYESIGKIGKILILKVSKNVGVGHFAPQTEKRVGLSVVGIDFLRCIVFVCLLCE